MNGDKGLIKQEIDKWFELHSGEMLSDLGRLIEVDSVAGPAVEGAPYGSGPRACLALAGEMLGSRGFDAEVFEDIVMTADLGPEPPLMGILAHVDVVAAGGGWDTDPLKMTLKDGKIYGRGTSDDKGPAVAAIYAMFCARDICPELKHGVRLILGSGEEVGCEDIANYRNKNELPPHIFTPDADYPVVNMEKGRFMADFGVKWDKDDTTPRIVSIEGGNTTNVVPASAKAVIEGLGLEDAVAFCREYSGKTGASLSAHEDGGRITITANGVSSHAAVPHKGNNAQTALIEMLAAMPFALSEGFERVRALKRLFPHGDHYGDALGIAMSDETSGKLTVNFGVLEFSETGFEGNFDSRTPQCADEADLIGATRGALEREGVGLTGFSLSKSHHTPEDSILAQTLLRVFEEYTGKPGRCLVEGGQTYVHGIPGGVAFGCAMPGTDYSIHGANEFIGIEELILSAKMFTRAIIEMCG